MKKFKLVRTGKEVKKGDTIIILEDVIPEGVEDFDMDADVIELTDETIKDLLKGGIIMEEEDGLCIEDIISHLAGREEVSFSDVDELLNVVDNISEADVFFILLKEAARMLDGKYPNHISKCDKVYTINLWHGGIEEVPTNSIVSYKGIAAFRNKEDVKEAIKALLPIWENLYGRKQEG